MRSRSRYGGYRGRRTGRDILKYIIVALVVLIAVLAAILFFGRDQLNQQQEEPDKEQAQTQEPVQPEPEIEPVPEPEPESEPEPEAMAAVGVDIVQVLDGSWKQYLEANGGNAVVLNMKPDDAVLNWATAQSAGLRVGASSQVEGINDKLRALNNGDVYTVARLSCFRDELLANTYEYCIHSNSGYRWKDFGGVHWVSPASAGVQDYLVGLAVELAELGFDEILLDNCGYPQDGSGEMGWIKRGEVYDLEQLDVVISAFLTKLHQAVEPYGSVISIRTNAEVVTDADAAKTGLTGVVLEEHADRVWLSEVETDAPLAEILTQAGVTDVGKRLVIQSAVLLPEGSWEQVVLDF